MAIGILGFEGQTATPPLIFRADWCVTRWIVASFISRIELAGTVKLTSQNEHPVQYPSHYCYVIWLRAIPPTIIMMTAEMRSCSARYMCTAVSEEAAASTVSVYDFICSRTPIKRHPYSAPIETVNRNSLIHTLATQNRIQYTATSVSSRLRTLSSNTSIVCSKASSPDRAILGFLFQTPVPSFSIKVIQ